MRVGLFYLLLQVQLASVPGIRKELIHALIGSAKPRSKLVKVAELALVGYGQDKLQDDAVTALIESVATYRAPSGLEAGVYVLKDECYGKLCVMRRHDYQVT